LLFQQIVFRLPSTEVTKLEAATMHHSLIVAYITIVVMVAHDYAQDLRVNIGPTRSQFTEEQAVEINLNYKNTGPKTVLIYNWYLPEQQLYDPLFEVTRDGKPIEYVGPLVKRGPPTAENMISIESGKSVSARVQLSSVYNMTETGNYAVQFKMNVGPMLITSARLLKIENPSSNLIGESILESPPVVLFAKGRPNMLIEQSAKISAQVKSTTYNYIGCSVSQKNLILAAVKSAASYSASCVQYLAKFSLPAPPRYTTWFGTYSPNNLITLKTHFSKINDVFNTKPMSFDCTCNMKNTYAFVYPTVPYEIHLCPVFWPSPNVGTNSKAGTLVHETSHFKIVAGTIDIAYGQSDCETLAKSNPTKALNNADSHEYFAENNPILK
jgi:peptidyl-Lys metalloendopeptidase